MAIYVGNTHPTGGTDVYIGSFTPNIYVGGYLTYPEGNIRYVFRNGALHYSSGSNLFASGSNYAWYAADVLMYNGSTFISSAANVTLTATKISGDTAFHINANNEVYADDRTNVTGSSRSATYRASYGDTTAATFTVTQAANTASKKEYTVGLTAYTEAFVVNGKYSYSGGTYYVPCNRLYDQWTAYTSGYMTSTSRTSTLVTAMTYLDTDYYSWLSTGTTQSGEGGYPRTLVVDENYSSGEGGSRSATIQVGYPVSGVWSDYNYVTTQATIEQWGRPQNTYAYRIASLDISSDTWGASEYGTANTHTITACCEYKTTTWQDGSTSSTGNWYTYTGRPDMCGGEKPYAMMGSGSPVFYIRDPESGTTGYTGYLYYPTTSTTYGTIGVFPYQANSSTSAKTQDVHISFGDASTPLLLTQQANISISVSPSTLSPASTGATNVFTVTSNVQGWTIGVSDSSWITATTSSGNMVQVKTAQNTSPASRTGYVYVKYAGSTAATCTINQAAMSYTFSAVTSTTPRVNANSTSVSLAIKSLQGTSAFPFTTSDASILTNNMGLAISNVTTGSETGLYYLNLTCTQNSSTALSRTASVIVRQPSPSVNTLTFYITQNPASSGSVDVPGVEKLFDLGDGWIVGRVCTSVGQPNDTHYYALYYARNDAGVNTTFNATGYYQIRVNGASPSNSYIPATLNYTSGHQISTTDYQGNPVSFYGWNFGGGPNATTNANMAGITYTT